MRAESIASISPSSVHPEYAAGVILQNRDVGGAGAQHVKVIAMQEEPEFRPPQTYEKVRCSHTRVGRVGEQELEAH